MIAMDNLDELIRTFQSDTMSSSIGELLPDRKQNILRKVMKNPFLYVALSTTLLAYVIFPGFLAGITLGFAFALLTIIWVSA